MSQNLKFVSINKASPEKRVASIRIKDFKEIYQDFSSSTLISQASRCSQCRIPLCQINCPLHNYIPNWLKLVAENRLKEAYLLSSSTNLFPEICGRVCPQESLCEGSCVIKENFSSVTIGAIEKHITEHAWQNGWVKPLEPKKELKYSVGIIGSGPAGLSAAAVLREYGYQVVVYERDHRVGGLLTYGIPYFKLDKSLVFRREELLRSSGISFQNNITIGQDCSFQDLRDKHDAILIATGVYDHNKNNIKGGNLKNIVPALEYLKASNKKVLNEEQDTDSLINQFDVKGKQVVVVGGGDTAMDCVRTALRQKAQAVTCLYRRDRQNMPGSTSEIVCAQEEGASFKWLHAPYEYLGEKEVIGIRVTQMQLGETDAHGRRISIPVPDSLSDIKADYVIEALGFKPENLPILFSESELQVTGNGTIKVDEKNLSTNLEGVFAAGDIIRKSSIVVEAIRDGRKAAIGIHQYISLSS